MTDTKENILITALRLFSRDGYEAVPVSAIAGELGMAKSALYKHYKNKRDIFDSIVQRMMLSDAERAEKYDMPDGTPDEAEDAYGKAEIEKLADFSMAQFKYWTEDEFPSRFRKMITLEQYRNPEMSELFRQYISYGPMKYTEDLFFAMTGNRKRSEELAVEFYAPMFLLYSIYDSSDDKAKSADMLKKHIDGFILKWNNTDGK